MKNDTPPIQVQIYAQDKMGDVPKNLLSLFPCSTQAQCEENPDCQPDHGSD